MQFSFVLRVYVCIELTTTSKRTSRIVCNPKEGRRALERDVILFRVNRLDIENYIADAAARDFSFLCAQTKRHSDLLSAHT